MKRIIIALFAFSVLLCACTKLPEDTQSLGADISNGSEKAVSTEPCESRTALETSGETVTNIYVSRGENGCYLANEYEYAMKSMLFSGGWIEDTAECLCDFSIRFPDAVFDYHSECGTVIWEGKSKRLSQADKANLNGLLFSALGIE